MGDMVQSEGFFLDLPYRGKRDYLHSASIANSLAERFPEATGFDLVMRGWMTNRLVFSPLAEGEMAGENGQVTIDLPEGRLRFVVTEDKAHPATERGPYDEDAVPCTLIPEYKRILVGSDPDFTFFDRVIAANKKLINGILAPGVKLIAVKIATPGFPPADADLALRLKSHVGTRIFKSAIEINGVTSGEVVFYGN